MPNQTFLKVQLLNQYEVLKDIYNLFKNLDFLEFNKKCLHLAKSMH
jgi:hypothetical protein